MSISDRAAGKAAWSWRADKQRAAIPYEQEAAKPWGGTEAYEQTVVMGSNNGRPLRRLLDVVDTPDGVKEVLRATSRTHLCGAGPTSGSPSTPMAASTTRTSRSRVSGCSGPTSHAMGCILFF